MKIRIVSRNFQIIFKHQHQRKRLELDIHVQSQNAPKTINVHIVLLNNCIWMERLIWMTLVQLNLVLFNPVEGCSLAGWCWAYTHTHSAPIIKGEQKKCQNFTCSIL